ncbi:Rubis-subs-bind domain-containing protein [Citrus sinensis]|nr:Rubis-subs-bind domain-containing protein [Citrus sinensis]
MEASCSLRSSKFISPPIRPPHHPLSIASTISISVIRDPNFGSSLRLVRRKNRFSIRVSSSDTLVAGSREVVSKKEEDLGDLKSWMHKNGLPPCKVILKEKPSHNEKHRPIHYVAASEDLQAGDVAFSVPNSLVVTLERVLGNETIAELLTTNKLSELACLALYLMYEKKQGKKSFWLPYIRELDRQRGRGQLAVESPLLWSETELAYLTGSPTKAEILERAEGIKREYNELDTVWFMAGSLFQQYPYDIPTEAFTFEIFKQAFVAVQSCVVHLQASLPLEPDIEIFELVVKGSRLHSVTRCGCTPQMGTESFASHLVHLQTSCTTTRTPLSPTHNPKEVGPGEGGGVKVSLARRFALVPLGPPLLAYSSKCKAMLAAVDDAVQLVVDRPYKAGESIVVWCGPQPNSKLLINYGFVDEDNPYDRLVVEAALNTEDPQYQDKRMVAQRNGKLSVQVHAGREKEAISDMLPYLRLGYVSDTSEMQSVISSLGPICPVSPCMERAVLDQLADYFKARLAGYPATLSEDEAMLTDYNLHPKKRVATQLVRMEKKMLNACLQVTADMIMLLPDVTVSPCPAPYAPLLN